MITGVIVALPEELTTLTRAKVRQGHFCQLTENILLAFAGAGPVNANNAAHLLHSNGAQRLISWGCAAALTPQLAPGNLVLPEAVINSDQSILQSNPQWLLHCRNILADVVSVHQGKLLGSDTLVSRASVKTTFFQKTEAIALDMESHAIATYAEHCKLPWLVIRAIADPVEMNLPKAIAAAMDSNGNIRLTRLLTHIALHPGQIPALIRLGLHFNKAKQTLRLTADYLDKITVFDCRAEQHVT